IARGWEAFIRLFNRGFDRLSHFYADAANFVIRHSVVMLLLYVALIGSAGWLLAITPQGFIPAQDRGYVIISVQLPGAASLDRPPPCVRGIERWAVIPRGAARVAAFAAFWAATGTRGGKAGALFRVFDEPGVGLKKGLPAPPTTADLRKRLSSIEG